MKKFSVQLKITIIFFFMVLCLCNIFPITFVRPYVYKNNCRLLRRIGKALDDNWLLLDKKATTIDSKLDFSNTELVSIESKLDQWIGPNIETLLLYKGGPSGIIPVNKPCVSGITIDQSGLYTLASNQTCCITIDNSDVTLDLSGFTLYCEGSDAVIKIEAGYENIVIKNGTIKSNAGATDGIFIDAGNEFVFIEDIRILSCDKGMHFAGASLANGEAIKSCKVKGCSVKECNKGVYGQYLIKTIFEKCETYNCVETGFCLESSNFNVFDNCKALETQNAVADDCAVGFSSGMGRGNLFRACVAEGISKITSNFCSGAVGFLLTGTLNNMEQETKIIDSVVNSYEVQAGIGGAYGFYIQSELVSGTEFPTPIVSNYDANVNSVAWSPNGRYLAIGGALNMSSANAELVVATFDGSTIRDVADFEHDDPINFVSWSPKGNYIAFGSNNPSRQEVEVLVFNGATLSTFASFGHTDDVYAVEWSPDGNYLVFVSENPAGQEIEVLRFDPSLDASDRLQSVVEVSYDGNVNTVSWSPDGQYLAVGGEDASEEIIVFRFDGGNLIPIDTFNHDADVNAVAFSPDGKYLAYGSVVNVNEEVGVLYFDGEALSDSPVATFGPHTGDVNSISWSPDGKYLVIGSNIANEELEMLEFNASDNTLESVKIYDVGVAVNGVSWSSDSRYIAIGTNSTINEVRVFEVMQAPFGCVIDNNKACNGTGSIQGSFGILGSGNNVYTRNVGFGNDVNFNKALYNRSGDALQNAPNDYDNIWLFGFYPGINM